MTGFSIDVGQERAFILAVEPIQSLSFREGDRAGTQATKPIAVVL